MFAFDFLKLTSTRRRFVLIVPCISRIRFLAPLECRKYLSRHKWANQLTILHSRKESTMVQQALCLLDTKIYKTELILALIRFCYCLTIVSHSSIRFGEALIAGHSASIQLGSDRSRFPSLLQFITCSSRVSSH